MLKKLVFRFSNTFNGKNMKSHNWQKNPKNFLKQKICWLTNTITRKLLRSNQFTRDNKNTVGYMQTKYDDDDDDDDDDDELLLWYDCAESELRLS